MLSSLSIAMIIVLVALITWLMLVPYGRCLAGDWTAGASGVPLSLKVESTGVYSASVAIIDPKTPQMSNVALYIIKITPATRRVKIATESDPDTVISEGTVAYGKKSITWDKTVFGTTTWTKQASKSK